MIFDVLCSVFLMTGITLSTPLNDAQATDLIELMTEGGKTEITEIDIGVAKAIIEGTNSRRRRDVQYGLEKNVRPMDCVMQKFNNIKFLGQLTGVAENVASEDTCGGICYQFNFNGGQCKSANFLKDTNKCELMADVFDANGPMGQFVTKFIESNPNSLYEIPISCKEEGGSAIPTPQIQSSSYFSSDISLTTSCGKSFYPNRVNTTKATNTTSMRIVGGIEARPNSMPWIVSIQENKNHFCGGSLIRCSEKDESRLILTAAHCLADVGNPQGLTVSLGEHTLTTKVAGEQTIAVSNIEINSEYDPYTSANDIAVIQLSQPVNFSQIIQPVCLPETDVLPAAGSPCIVAGWGYTSEGAYTVSNYLMQVVAPIMSDTVCMQDYVNEIQPDKMFCAGYNQGQKDSCQGDSGGPYICYSGDTATQFGVVSFGQGCARPNKPGVYTRVPHYRSWIDGMRSKYCE